MCPIVWYNTAMGCTVQRFNERPCRPTEYGRMTAHVARNDRYYNVMDNIPCRASAHLTASAVDRLLLCGQAVHLSHLPLPLLSHAPPIVFLLPRTLTALHAPFAEKWPQGKCRWTIICVERCHLQLRTREFPLLYHHYCYQLQLVIMKVSIHSMYRQRFYFNKLILFSIVRRRLLYVTDIIIILLVNFAKTTWRQAVLLSVYLSLTPASRI